MLIKEQRNIAEANELHGAKFSLVSIKTQRNKVRGETFTLFSFHFHLQSPFEAIMTNSSYLDPFFAHTAITLTSGTPV